MDIGYKKLKKFMLAYCRDYNRYANDEETIHEMDQYWSPKFNVTAYFHRQTGDYPVVYASRREFQDFLIATHQNIKDSMNIEDIIVDHKESKVVLRVKIKKEDKTTGEEVAQIDGIGCYKLALDQDNNIKIVSLDFIWDAPDKIKNLGSKGAA